jgi:hypothetical protein
MFLMTDINRSAVIRTANFKRGRDKVKRKKKKGINYKETKDTVKVGQKLASTGTNISRELRGWLKLVNRTKDDLRRLNFLRAARQIAKGE